MMPERNGTRRPERKRLHKYQRALAAFGRVASVVLPRERLLRYRLRLSASGPMSGEVALPP